MLPIICAIRAYLVARDLGRADRGQSTAEYALVLLGAAAIAVLVISWATNTNLVGKLFDFVLGKVMGRAG